MKISGGSRFLPVFGRSGSGKSCAALELATHLPQSRVFSLTKQHVEDHEHLVAYLKRQRDLFSKAELFICVVDQFEEAVKGSEGLPTKFVEQISLIDRSDLAGQPILFLWLTTDQKFQASLATATSRNERLLVSDCFELVGPKKETWAQIIEETFAFHNSGKSLSDFNILRTDLDEIVLQQPTIGRSIEATVRLLGSSATQLQDLSQYQVIMLWPVTDGLRITRVSQFSEPRLGYRLDWNAWYKELNAEDREQLPLHEYNRARLYFDMRVVPIAAADLHAVCKNLDDSKFVPPDSYLDRFKKTHFYAVAVGEWDSSSFAVLRERDSERSRQAKQWYESVTSRPHAIAQRLVNCFKALGHEAYYEKEIKSPNGRVVADALVIRPSNAQREAIIELKAFNTDGTRPSSIRDAIRTTLKRHAMLAGFISRQ